VYSFLPDVIGFVVNAYVIDLVDIVIEAVLAPVLVIVVVE